MNISYYKDSYISFKQSNEKQVLKNVLPHPSPLSQDTHWFIHFSLVTKTKSRVLPQSSLEMLQIFFCKMRSRYKQNPRQLEHVRNADPQASSHPYRIKISLLMRASSDSYTYQSLGSNGLGVYKSLQTLHNSKNILILPWDNTWLSFKITSG